MDLALNNLQRLICHKTPTNKPRNKSMEDLLRALDDRDEWRERVGRIPACGTP